MTVDRELAQAMELPINQVGPQLLQYRQAASCSGLMPAVWGWFVALGLACCRAGTSLRQKTAVLLGNVWHGRFPA